MQTRLHHTSLIAASAVVEWDRTAGGADSDGFEVAMDGADELQCHIQLSMAYSPPRYKLSSQLSR